MSRIEISLNDSDDRQEVLEQIAADIDAEGWDVTTGVNNQGQIILSGRFIEVSNMVATEGFADRFFPTLAIDQVIALIAD